MVTCVPGADSQIGQGSCLRSAALACAVAWMVVLACAGPTRADGPETPEVRPADRPMPDYDGLPEPGDDAGDVALWTARVITSPLYLVSEYVLRIPIGWVMTEIERHDVIDTLRDFFTFGPNDTIAVFPTFFYELGFQPNVGLYASWDQFLFPANRISVHGATGGDDWLTGSVADRIAIDDDWQVGAKLFAHQRPDYVFGGIGPDATALPRARFGAQRVDVDLWSAARFWQSSDVEWGLRYRSIGFIDEGWSGEPSVGERAQANGQPVPYGFATGYEAISTELLADLDTRTPGAPPEGGVRLAAHLGQHGAFGGLPALDRWMSWGGSATLATDAAGQHRVLGLTGDAHFVSPLDGSSVPFTELVDLGGIEGLLPGYRPGHVQGLSAVGLTAHYTWPIWAFLDAQLFVGTANAFGHHLEDFDVELLRLTFGLELQPRVQDVHLPFQIDFGFATDTFARGSSIDSFRLAIGARDAL